MATHLKNLSTVSNAEIRGNDNFTLAIIVSEYNSEITFAMRDACVKTLLAKGMDLENIVIESVPGAFELPFGAKIVFDELFCDAVIVLGCVIKGDTDHDIYINQAVTNALMNFGMENDLPVIFGLLTTNTLEQAQDRAGGKHGNKGIECAEAAIKMMNLQEKYFIEDEDINPFLN